ncbi:MAG TPA: erythromycin esterase family protein [Thermoanaerobaculia bacterium]|nr:erythromycin esterase family protein [Thermoanaerobaculia bacterium]
MQRRVVLAALTVILAVSASGARRRAVHPPGLDRDLDTVGWLRATAAPFDTTKARSGLDDLNVLSTIVDNARIVSLGEATHGSSEFFTMKHRILEYLVERKGFTVFAIEANLPEADAVDDYVVNGRGNAAAALTGMYFWTWDTAEVLDMIEWMREYNLRRGNRPPLRFRGFDAQFMHGGIALIDAYVRRIDRDRATSFNALYDCMRGYNQPDRYGALPAETRNACAAKVALAFTTLQSRRAEYAERSGAEEYEKHLRYARTIVQAEAIWSRRADRDELMAENVEWLADVAHPGEKLVLWAHNGHVSAESPFRMGSFLRTRFGSDMVIFGFDFDRGAFTSNGPTGLGTWSINEGPLEGWEEYFREAHQPRFFLDLRNVWSRPAADYVHLPQRMWSIGSVWDPTNVGGRHRFNVAVANAYDVIIYIEVVTASRLNRGR